MNDGESLTRIDVFFSVLPVANAVASVASSVCSPRTISSSGITATGLKKWKPTTRSGCARPLAISVTDRDEVLVASTHVSETTASTSANTCCLTFISSKTASMTKSASAKSGLVGRAGDEGLEPVGPVVVHAALGEQRVDLAVHVGHALVDARLVEVGEHDRHLEPLGEQQRELAGHQAGADDADLGHRPGERLVRSAGRPLGALLHQVEGVEPGAQLVGHR